MPRQHALGTAAGLAAIVLWSATMALIRSLSEQLGPMAAAAAVYSVSGIASVGRLACAPARFGSIMRLPRRYLLGCGALFVAYMLVLFLAVGLAKDRSQMLEVGLLNYLWPALTILLSVVLLGKTAGWLLIPATILGTGGVLLVLAQGESLSWHTLSRNVAANPAAYALGLAAACFWALYSNLTRRWAGAEREGAVDLFLPVTGLVLLLLCLAFPASGAWTGRAIAETLGLGTITWTAYRLWDLAMRKGDVVLVSACSYLTPVLSTLLSCCYLGVSPAGSLWIGCLLIVAGSVVSWLSVTDRASSR